MAFARAFYEAVADGLPVDAAVVEARIAVSLAVNNTMEWGTPVLHMRSPDGRIFERIEPVSAPRSAEPEPDPLPELHPSLDISLSAAQESVNVGEEVAWNIVCRNTRLN